MEESLNEEGIDKSITKKKKERGATLTVEEEMNTDQYSEVNSDSSRNEGLDDHHSEQESKKLSKKRRHSNSESLYNEQENCNRSREKEKEKKRYKDKQKKRKTDRTMHEEEEYEEDSSSNESSDSDKEAYRNRKNVSRSRERSKEKRKEKSKEFSKEGSKRSSKDKRRRRRHHHSSGSEKGIHSLGKGEDSSNYDTYNNSENTDSEDRHRRYKSSRKKETNRRSKSRARSHSESRSRSKSISRSRSKSRVRSRMRSGSSTEDRRRRHRDRYDYRDRERDRRRREREREREREKIRERIRKEREREREKEREREREEAKRDDLTVLVLNLSLNVNERDIYEFFSEVAGKVRDIQCIKDQRSGKSKGVAYVEFYTQESVIKALAANGLMLKNRAIKVQSSQAEKNRAAKLAKQHPIDPNDIPLKLYIGGLLGPLSNISEQELKQLFTPFGDILDIEIHRDPYTGKSKGFGFIQFHRASEAIEAMNVLNGIEVAGREIKVGYAQDSKYLLACDNTQENILQKQKQKQKQIEQKTVTEEQDDNEKIDNDENDGGGLISGAGSKITLMQKLQRQVNISEMTSGKNETHNMTENNHKQNVTCNLVLRNMFSPNDINIGKDPDFFTDIIEDVREECKKYGDVKKVWLNSKNIDGTIYIKYSNSEESSTAFQFLNGRYFGGSLIQASFISDAAWETCVSNENC